MPHNLPIFIGITSHQYHSRRFDILEEGRFSHTYLIRRTDTGNSTLLETMAQFIERRHDIALIDPLGHLAPRVVACVKKHCNDNLIYLVASDATQPHGYNPLRDVYPRRIPLAAPGLIDAQSK